MAEKMTDSAQAVIRSAHNHSAGTMLDAACKQVLAIKGVLARILKDCVPEFADVDVKDISYKYIEGEPQVSVVGVSPDETAADGGLKKVYGIWICLQPAEKRKGTITRYFPQEDTIFARFD